MQPDMRTRFCTALPRPLVFTPRSTSHIFLDLPKLSPKLQEYIDRTSQMGGWSSNCVQVSVCVQQRCHTQQVQGRSRW
jgi:hypothetical protein